MGRWAYSLVGEGEPVVVLHGIFGDRNNWKTLVQKISGWAHYLVDLPGHGETPSSPSWRLADLARQGWDWVDELGLERPILMGHSWGGKIAWEMALQRPHQTRALILGDIGPGTTPIRLTEIGAVLSRAGAFEERDQVKAELLRHFEPNLAGFFLKSWKARGRWAFDLEAFLTHAEILRRGVESGRVYPGPTLQLWGERSEYPTPQALEDSRPFFPNLTTRFIPDAGHWFHAENPTDTLRALQEFLAGVP